MPTTKFKQNLDEFRKSIKLIKGDTSKLYKFEDVQGQYYKNRMLSCLIKLKEDAKGFTLISDDHNTIQKLLTAINDLERMYIEGLDDERKKKTEMIINQIDRIITTIDFKHEFLEKRQKEKEKKEGMNIYRSLNIPYEIREELLEDIEEMHRCFDSNCYKASTIISGRILETALLRLYFDKTGNDLLETAPGIGLGKVIAKLNEKGIELGPGINEQIHLVNKVRINSVHARNDFLRPSKEQANAIMLFTLDILKRVFY